MNRLKTLTRVLPFFALGIAATAMPSCSDDDKRNLALDKGADAGEAEKTPSASEEAERLRRLQLIRVHDLVADKWEEREASELIPHAYTHCATHIPSAPSGGCASVDNATQIWLCLAHTMADLAGLRSSPLTLDQYGGTPGTTTPSLAIPQPDAAGQVALLRVARTTAKVASGIEVVFGPGKSCWSNSTDFTEYGPRVASNFAEAYYLFRELTEKTSDAVLAYADRQRSHPSAQTGLERGFKAAELSRAEAAHLWVGGTSLDNSSTNSPFFAFCTAPNTSATVKTAIHAIRNAAPPPEALKDKKDDPTNGLTLDQFVEAGTTGVASIKERLAVFWDQPMADPSSRSLASQLGITMADFELARGYLKDEFYAFSRSPNAQLPPVVTGTRFARYSALASEPSTLPAAYYGAIATVGDDGSPPLNLETSPQFTTIQSYADYVDVAAIRASQWLNAAPSDAAQTALSPLGLVLADAARERPARWQYCSAPQAVSVRVDGYGSSDGIFLIVGDDAMRCASTGSIEGAPCSVETSPTGSWTENSKWALPIPSSDPINVPGFHSNVGGIFSSLSGTFGTGARVYLAQAVDPVPGKFKILSGMKPKQNVCRHKPIVPDADSHVAKILAASSKFCSASAVSCLGTFDERLPLENELSDNGDGVENSWRTYLEMAKGAAAEADRLAEDYINDGITKEERSEGQELREKANDVQMMQELETLQNICGTNADPIKLLNFFKALQDTVGDTCGSTAMCNANMGYACIGGKCVRDPMFEAALSLPRDQWERLRACLATEETYDFVTMGDADLCIWVNPINANEICAGASPQHPCPTFATNGNCSLISLPTSYAHHRKEHIPPSRQLGYFKSGQAVTPHRDPGLCENVRHLRKLIEVNAPGGGGVQLNPSLDTSQGKALNAIVSSNFFHPINLAPVARRIGYRTLAGSFSEITVDGRSRYRTGDLWSGRAQGVWPCLNPPPTCNEKMGLFCGGWDCENEYARTDANERMMRAVVGARNIALDGRAEGVVPLPLVNAPNSLVNLGLPTRKSIGFRPRWDNVPVEVFTYDGRDYTSFQISTSNAPDNIAWRRSKFYYASTVETGGWGASPVPFYPPELLDFYFNSTNPAQVFVEVAHRELPTDITVKRTGWWDGLSSAAPYVPAPGEDTDYVGHFKKLFTGERDIRFPSKDTRHMTTFRPEGVNGDANNFNEVNNANPLRYMSAESTPYIRPFDYRNEELLDAMELLCQVGMELDVSSCNPNEPPTIATVDDLRNAKAYMECLATTISQKASRSILAKFPKDAFDALRKASVLGTFPENGGEWGVELTNLHNALVTMSGVAPQLAQEISAFGSDIDSVRISLIRSEIADKMQQVELASKIADRLAACANSLASSISTFGASAAVDCANSVAQINYAHELNDLTRQDSEKARELMMVDFASIFSTRAGNIGRYSEQYLGQLSVIEGSLNKLENLQAQARRAIAKAIYMNTDVAASTMPIDAAYRRRFNTKRVRYEAATKNAHRLAFLAKRAIEQRLGMSLASMQEDMPLVEAPAKWEASICTTRGIDLANAEASAPATTSTPGHENYADLFVGDYTRNLENLVESYRLVNGFQEGTDTAVVSLRDDIQRVRRECEVPVRNLLKYSSELTPDAPDANAWKRVGCGTTTVAGVTTLLPSCINGFRLASNPPAAGPFNPTSDPEAGRPNVFEFKFGTGAGTCPVASCGFRANSAVAQKVELRGGRYVLSWYAGAGGGSMVSLTNSARVDFPSSSGSGPVVAGLTRYHKVVTVDVAQAGFVEIRTPVAAGTGATILLSALQLERFEDVVNPPPAPQPGPRRYVETGRAGTRMLKQCEDSTGSEFRATRWTRGCLQLCSSGLGGNCEGTNATSYCYRETTFGINQRDIDSGKVFVNSGFARGNFNYRVESIGLNFVGSGVRDCSESPLPQSCYSGGYVPFSLYQTGPFYVRNHLGNDFEAKLFDGKIEHARGLGSERFLTNPISSADRSLLEPYFRSEFRGRPLDGNFVLRVWDDPNVDFDSIQDVQVVLNYRYWTRQN